MSLKEWIFIWMRQCKAILIPGWLGPTTSSSNRTTRLSIKKQGLKFATSFYMIADVTPVTPRIHLEIIASQLTFTFKVLISFVVKEAPLE